MKTDLPTLSHLQFAILDCLGADELTGKELRVAMGRRGFSKNGPAFYQLMSRLEGAGMVEGSMTQEIVDSQIIKERKYKATREGISAAKETSKFYSR